MKTPNLNTDQFISLLYVAAFFIALFVVYKILGKIGIIQTRQDKKEDQKEAEASSDLRAMKYFDPLYLKGRTDYKPMGANVSKVLAGEIKNAMAGFGTNEEKIFAVFAKLPSKDAISELSLNYTANFKKFLIAELLNELTDSEKVTLIEIINKLP